MKAWGSLAEATAILSKNAGRPIYQTYVRQLAKAGKVRARVKDGRTNEYSLSDCRAYYVRERKAKQDDDHRSDDE
jgi:hypothetical protein